MLITLICFGKMDSNGFANLENYYATKIKRFIKLEIIELKEQGTTDLVKNQKNNEVLLEKYLENGDINILLDINGKEFSSETFSEFVQSHNIAMNNRVNYFIGPSDGFSQGFRERFLNKLSFGRNTFPHQLSRIILLEQLYRAFKIANNEKYHK